MRQGKFNEALQRTETGHTAADRVFHTLISGAKDLDRARLEELDEERRFAELVELKRYIWVLATSGASAPFIGLFGTVVGILVARTAIALACSSVWLYLLQPVAASVLMSVVFVGSALIGRPVTQRLAEDFVRLPERLLADRRMRRVFVEVALIWGVSRAIDAAIGLDSLHWGAGVGVLARGVLSTGLTALSIGACVYWGWRRVQAIPGVRFSIGAPLAS